MNTSEINENTTNPVKVPWYLSTWFIVLVFIATFMFTFGIPAAILAIIRFAKYKQNRKGSGILMSITVSIPVLFIILVCVMVNQEGKADRLIKEGHYAEAQVYLDDRISSSNDYLYYRQYADLYIAQGMFDEAVQKLVEYSDQKDVCDWENSFIEKLEECSGQASEQYKILASNILNTYNTYLAEKNTEEKEVAETKTAQKTSESKKTKKKSEPKEAREKSEPKETEAQKEENVAEDSWPSETIYDLSSKEMADILKTMEIFLEAYTTADYDTAIQYCAKGSECYETFNIFRTEELYKYMALEIVYGDEEYAKKLAANRYFKEITDLKINCMFNGEYLVIKNALLEDDTVKFRVIVERNDNMDIIPYVMGKGVYSMDFYDYLGSVEELYENNKPAMIVDIFEKFGNEVKQNISIDLLPCLLYWEHECDILLKKTNDKWLIVSITEIDGEDERAESDESSFYGDDIKGFDTDMQEYIFPDSDSRYLSEEEVKDIETDKLRIARNEIFARHGYIFNDEELNQYFNGTSWYNGTVPAEQFNMDAVLNDFEKKNIELIEGIESGVNGTGNEQEAGKFIIPAGTYVNNGLFEGHQALMKLTYYDDEEIGVEFLTEPQLNSINLYGFKIDDRTIQVAEEYEGIIVTLTWDNENEVTAVSSGEFTGMDSSLFNEMTNAHYSFITGD